MFLAAEFPLESGLAYLNHAAVSPWPRRTAQAVERFALENLVRGAERYPEWTAVQQRLRERAARLIGAASPDDIALLKNTSEGLSMVAFGLDWREGDRIVGIGDDFPSNRMPWQALADRGVHFDGVALPSEDPEGALIERIDARTRLMAVSSVHYATGLRLDLERLADACRRRGVLLCVDAIQSLGAVPFDLRRVPADFVVADGHKWLLGPEGVALFHVAPALRGRLRLHEYGWAMAEHAGDHDRDDWVPARSARRFECGSPNLLGIHALEASLSLIEEVGIERIGRHLLERVAWLRERIRRLPGVEIVTPEAPERHAGILSFGFSGVDSRRLWRALMARRVVCACRGGRIRFSPHFYTREAQMAQAIEALRDLLD